MEKLSAQQIQALQNHLYQSGSNEILLSELTDHLACQVEYYMWIGLPFETALEKTLLEASRENIIQLADTYEHEMAQTDATLDDIVFATRNKAYGAYYLRRSYTGVLGNAVAFSVGAFLMLLAFLRMSQGKWSYFSIWGAMWVLGLVGVIYAVLSWYLQSQRQRLMVASNDR